MPWLYRAIGIRAGLRPRIVADDPQPHRFAQGFSGTVTLAGAVTVALGAPAAGWPAVLLVAALAVLNITVGFCAGCFTYLQLRRIGIVGRTA